MGQIVDKSVHCDTRVSEIRAVGSRSGKRYSADGHQHVMLSYERFPKHSSELLSLKDSLNIKKKGNVWVAPNGRLFIDVLPVFTKDQAFQSYYVFENTELPKTMYDNGRFTILTKRTRVYKGDIQYYIRAVAYRDGKPVISTQVSLDSETKFDISFTHQPGYAHLLQIRDAQIFEYQKKLSKGEITESEYSKLRHDAFIRAYKAHGLGKVSSITLSCDLR